MAKITHVVGVMVIVDIGLDLTDLNVGLVGGYD
jgi:hypothetical protein